MIDLESINNDIRRIIEKTGKVEKRDLSKERIAAKFFLFQNDNAELLARWNLYYSGDAISDSDNKNPFGELLSKQDEEKIKKQTKELSVLIKKLCRLLKKTRSEMENELGLPLFRLEWEN